MARRSLVLVCWLATTIALAGCSGPPPRPEGYPLTIQFMSVSPAAIDTLVIRFEPLDEDGMPRTFEPIEPTSFEDGAITLEVQAGLLVMTITGDYVRTHLLNDDPLNPRFAIRIYSEDERMRRGPRVSVTVRRGTDAIANGNGYLPAWPPPLDEAMPNQINVPCHPEFVAACMGG